MIVTEQIQTPFADWCFERSIYFYGYTFGCDPGFCTITKWVDGVPTIGKKVFPVINLKFTIKGLYEQVYKQSNQ